MKAYAVPVLATTLFATSAVADHDLIFPFVDMGEAGANSYSWENFTAQVMNVENGLTTYSVGCPTTATCGLWSNLGDFTYTIAISPNTFDMVYSDLPVLSTHTACTFTGTPATSASCEMTNAGTIRTSTLGYEYHFTVPAGTDTGTGVGDWGLWNVQSATLRVVDGTATASGSATTATPAGSKEGGSALVTPAPTGTGVKSGKAPVSTGAALRKGVEGWMVGVGMGVAGAVFGV